MKVEVAIDVTTTEEVVAEKEEAQADSEEEAVGLTQVVPFLVENMLQERGGRYEKGADWGVHVVTDGKLVTGSSSTPSFFEQQLQPVASVAEGRREAGHGQAFPFFMHRFATGSKVRSQCMDAAADTTKPTWRLR